MKWIKISDKIPEEDQEILFGNPVWDEVYHGYFNTGGVINEYSFRCWEGYFDEYFNVTHWMPLPNPPNDAI